MKTIKPQKLGVLTRCFEREQTCYFAVSALGYFQFGAPSKLLSEVAMWKTVPDELGEVPLDLGMPKFRGEFLVKGSAYPPGGSATTCPVTVAVGTLRKQLWVIGDRHWAGKRQSDPRPFSQMPISWENAYGGEAFKHNPLGKGHQPVETEHGPVRFLPNVETPGKLVRSPTGKPAPVSFMPLDYAWPQRFSKLGTYDRKWLASGFPGLARDIDWSLWNAAPADQQQEHPFTGNEPFEVHNMHPDHSKLTGQLPGVKARCFVTHQIGSAQNFDEISMRLTTVWLFPHLQTGVVIFQGSKEIHEDDGNDIVHLVLGAEALDTSKPEAHYAKVLEKRLDKESGAVEALNDDDLMPPRQDGETSDPMAGVDEPLKEIVKTEGLMRQNMRRRQLAENERARAHVESLGLNPDDYAPVPAEDPEVPTEPAALVELVQSQEKQADAMREQADKKKAEMEDRMRQACEAQGVDYEEFVKENARKGPPTFRAQAELDRLGALCAEAREREQPMEAFEAQLADPEFAARLHAQESQLYDAYRHGAHHMDVAVVGDGQGARFRDALLEAVKQKQSLANMDFTGADLSGLDLSGADLQGAFLEAAILEGCVLRGANLQRTVLAHANLKEANLDGASLAEASFGAANLSGASLEGCEMAGAILARANLTDATLRGANLNNVDMMEATLSGADLRDVKGEQLSFMKSDMAGAKLDGASLVQCNFLEMNIDGVSCQGATFRSSVFLTVQGKNTDFSNADMTNVRFVMNCVFDGSRFENAKLPEANLRGTSLKNADFTRACLDAADLSECDLQAATLVQASAKDALLIRTDLRKANAQSSNFMNAILQKADLRGADFRSANLFAADFARIHSDRDTNVKSSNQKRVRVNPVRKS